jgi:ABC-type protease/lipase transport system fused ATPase/permease subunit
MVYIKMLHVFDIPYVILGLIGIFFLHSYGIYGSTIVLTMAYVIANIIWDRTLQKKNQNSKKIN